MARLRFADESLIESQFACPDCGQGIEIARGDGEWRAVPATIAKRTESPQAATSRESETVPPENTSHSEESRTRSNADRLAEWIGRRESDVGQSKDQFWKSFRTQSLTWLSAGFGWLQSPIAVAWTVAAIVTLTIIIWLLKDEPWGSPIRKPVQVATGLPDATDAEPTGEAEQTIAEQQLSELSGRMQDYVELYGHFPRARVSFHELDEGQFSWLATLEVEFPSTSRPGQFPLWDRGWQDPINEEFVRRRLPALINPLVPQQVGEDRYPISHYVGVAGLGVDGPTLPANHPRAGIFGIDRVTRPEDIIDGAANTIMIAGVTSGLGSWANPETAIRPFTQEPYINGPDGFGTGQDDGMFVLMADGSVKFLSTQTDPVVLRRMTAMADGFSLDPSDPGDPLDAEPPVMVAEHDPVIETEPQPMVEPPPMPERSPDELALLQEPIDVPVAIEPPRVYIERSLQVSLRRFEQPEVELRLVLRTLEELIGYSFGWNVPDTAEWQGVLDRTVTVSLENTTVEGVLSEVLSSVGLTYRLEDEGIYIEPM